MRVIFWGTSTFAATILEALAASPWRPSLVVTAPDAPAGRTLAVRRSPVCSSAERLGLTLIQPEELNSVPEGITLADLFVVAAYGKILPEALLRIPRLGAINVHPSLLPHWRGASPIQATILAGETETGVTLIAMDAKMDHGPIIANEKFEIQNGNMTAPELANELARLGSSLLLKTLPQWVEGALTPEAQDDRAATFTRMIKKEDGHIDWRNSAEVIERTTRAYLPWPGAYTFWKRNEKPVRLRIVAAQASPDVHREQEPGTVIRDTDAFAIVTGKGALRVLRLKSEGGPEMDAVAFLNGHSDILGALLA